MAEVRQDLLQHLRDLLRKAYKRGWDDGYVKGHETARDATIAAIDAAVEALREEEEATKPEQEEATSPYVQALKDVEEAYEKTKQNPIEYGYVSYKGVEYPAIIHDTKLSPVLRRTYQEVCESPGLKYNEVKSTWALYRLRDMGHVFQDNNRRFFPTPVTNAP
jgi:hypothetical protein